MPARRRRKAKVVEPEPDGPFTRAQIAEYKEAFEIFDKDGDGKVTLHEIEALVNAVGFVPQENELEQLLQRLDQTGQMRFNFEEFMQVAEHFSQQINMEEILLTCFRVFFGDEKRAKVDELKQILMGIGNPLTDLELKQMFWNLDPDGDEWFDIQELVTLILGKKEDEGEPDA
jgi:Ca2+-binding EF-hand superfamily protein